MKILHDVITSFLSLSLSLSLFFMRLRCKMIDYASLPPFVPMIYGISFLRHNTEAVL
jgi:hypothetical protein